MSWLRQNASLNTATRCSPHFSSLGKNALPSMGFTLHLLPANEAGRFLSLLAANRTWETPIWQRYFGLDPVQMEGLRDVVREILDGRSMTRAELTADIVKRPGYSDSRLELESGWGTLFKPLAWQGDIVFGPNKKLYVPDEFSGAVRTYDTVTQTFSPFIPAGSMTTAIDRLEARKLVQRRSHPEDRRARLVDLTPSGRKLIECAFAAHAKSMNSLGCALTADERMELMRLLKKFGRAAEAGLGGDCSA